jgi:hypothetical protein
MRSIVQAFVVVGDNNGHVGLGVKCAKEVGTCSFSPSNPPTCSANCRCWQLLPAAL